jgi:hypothetical protein
MCLETSYVELITYQVVQDLHYRSVLLYGCANYSLRPKLLDTFNKSYNSPKLDDLFLIYPNLNPFFGNLAVHMKNTLPISLDSKFQLILTYHGKDYNTS